MGKTKPKKINYFGVNIGKWPRTEKHRMIYFRAIKELGCQWVRIEFDFSSPVELKLASPFLKELRREGVNILGLLGYSVPGSLKNLFAPGLSRRPIGEQLADFVKFAKEQIKGFKKYINHWEILNEINTKRFWIEDPDPQEYAFFLKEASREIKKIDPKAKIAAAAICSDDRSKIVPFQRLGFYREMAKHLGDGDFEIASFHPYLIDCYFSFQAKEFYYQEFKKRLRRIEELVAKDKQLWITEYGISPRWVRISQPEIAWVYFQALKHCQQRKIPFFIWQLCDFDEPEHELLSPERHFGLLDENLKEKPVLQELVKLIERD